MLLHAEHERSYFPFRSSFWNHLNFWKRWQNNYDIDVKDDNSGINNPECDVENGENRVQDEDVKEEEIFTDNAVFALQSKVCSHF